jgi:hypothetical protein
MPNAKLVNVDSPGLDCLIDSDTCESLYLLEVVSGAQVETLHCKVPIRSTATSVSRFRVIYFPPRYLAQRGKQFSVKQLMRNEETDPLGSVVVRAPLDHYEIIPGAQGETVYCKATHTVQVRAPFDHHDVVPEEGGKQDEPLSSSA